MMLLWMIEVKRRRAQDGVESGDGGESVRVIIHFPSTAANQQHQRQCRYQLRIACSAISAFPLLRRRATLEIAYCISTLSLSSTVRQFLKLASACDFNLIPQRQYKVRSSLTKKLRTSAVLRLTAAVLTAGCFIAGRAERIPLRVLWTSINRDREQIGRICFCVVH